MREIAGTMEDFANKTWPANANATLSLSLTAFISCSIGVPANILVICLSLFSSKIQGEYKYFIANLAFCDLSYCLSCLFQCVFHLYHRFGNVPMNVTRCNWQTFLPYTTGLCTGFAIPLASINRYVVIVLDKDYWFEKKRTVLLLCLTAYIPVSYMVISFLFSPYVVYFPYCNYTSYIPFGIEPFFAYVIAIVYPTIIFCNYRLYRVLSKHMSSLKTILNKTTSQVENERSILKAIVLQGALPAISAFPIGMVLFGMSLSGWPNVTVVLFHWSDDLVLTLPDVCWCIYVTTPSIDALIDLFVVKQYRTALAHVLSRFPCKFCGESLVTAVQTPIEQSSRVSNVSSSNNANNIRAKFLKFMNCA
jgi:hypothetical protein